MKPSWMNYSKATARQVPIPACQGQLYINQSIIVQVVVWNGTNLMEDIDLLNSREVSQYWRTYRNKLGSLQSYNENNCKHKFYKPPLAIKVKLKKVSDKGSSAHTL